jgi:ABC-type antimicrobial peptide transport system permease subunit
MCIAGINGNFPGYMMLADDTLQRITGTPCVDSWEIVAESDDAVEKQLATLIRSNPNIRLQTYLATVEERQVEFAVGWGMLLVLALLLGVFGIINLVNTNVAGILSRKREMAILRMIGMTGRQTCVSLIIEGVINALVATVISVGVGLPVGYASCILVNEPLIAMYAIPWQAVLLHFVTLLAIQLLLAYTNTRIISMVSAIELTNTAT